MIPPHPTESAEQQALFAWAALQACKYPELRLLFHVPNGGKRSISEAVRFKAEGVKAGVPDLFLPVARGGFHGLFIELKASRGKVSALQNEWLTALAGQGYRAEICFGSEEARGVLTGYLKLGK